MLYEAIKLLSLPPACILLWIGLAFLIRHWFKRTGTVLLCLGIFTGYLFMTPWLVNHLKVPLEREYAPIDIHGLKAAPEAIVILGAGRYKYAPEFDGDSFNAQGLARLHYGMQLYREFRVPVILSGGARNLRLSETEDLPDLLKHQYGVEDITFERDSTNTWTNAQHTRRLLNERGIHRIILVTHAAHMKRSVYAFEAFDLEVIPAPTQYTTIYQIGSYWLQWIPSANALADNSIAIREIFGLWWYRFNYGQG